jgi:outer membrane receptor for ferric coprogen and ferric-rhodotorulic acid
MDKAVRTTKRINLNSRQKSSTKISKIAFSIAAALLLSTTVIPLAQVNAAETEIALNQKFDIKLPSGSLTHAITELSLQTKIQILVASDLIEDVNVAALSGRFRAETALTKLVENTGLLVKRSGNSGLTLVIASDQLSSQTATYKEKIETIQVNGSYTRTEANSATGLNMSLRETPQAITVMTKARMDDQNLHEISEVLEQAVGINYNGSTLGADGQYFYSRGFEVTNYQINGVSRPAGIYGFQLNTSDMTSYDRIEIVRGATGLMNGVGNPSASINLIRKQASEEFNGLLSAQIGSWNHTRFEGDLSGSLVDSGKVRARVAASTQSDDTHVDRINFSKEAVFGVIETDLWDETLFSVGFEYQSLKNIAAPRGGLPLYYSDNSETNFDRSSNTSAEWGELTNTNTNIFLSLEHELNADWLIKVNAEHAEPAYHDSMGYMAGNGLNVDGTGDVLYSARWSAELKQDFIAANISGAFDWLGNEQEVVLGVAYSNSEDDALNYCGWWCDGNYVQPIDNVFDFMADGITGVTKPDLSATGGSYGSSIEQSSAYGALRLKPIDNISLVLGSRVTNWKEVGWSESSGEKTYKEANEEKGVITPYLGVIANFNEYISGYASFTQIFEPQNKEDINGIKLDPLEGNNAEVGLKSSLFNGLLDATMSIYRIEQDNYAVYIPGVVGPNGGNVYRAEQGTTSEGFELEVAGEILPDWQVVGGFSRFTANNSDDKVLLTNIPNDNFKLFSSYQFDDFTFGGNIRWQGKTYVDDGGVNGDTYYEQDSLVIVDLMAKYYLSDEILIQLNANNIFDKNYYSGFSIYSVSYGTPRSITATLKWDF